MDGLDQLTPGATVALFVLLIALNLWVFQYQRRRRLQRKRRQP